MQLLVWDLLKLDDLVVTVNLGRCCGRKLVYWFIFTGIPTADDHKTTSTIPEYYGL